MDPLASTTLATEAEKLLGRPLDPAQVDLLLRYLQRLLELNLRVNLTAIRDFETAVSRHLLDSLAFGVHVRGLPAPPRNLLDLGSGGGFPGVPIAIAWPETSVLVLDGTRKKVDAVETICTELGIPNVLPLWGRAEELPTSDRELAGAFDCVTARAVGPLAEIIPAARPLLAPGGFLVAWKSAGITPEERQLGEVAARAARLRPRPDCTYVVGSPALLIRYEALR